MAEATRIACLTPAGKAAIATLAVRGPLAWSATRALFRPRHGSLPDTPAMDCFWIGRLGNPVGDDVVLAVKRIEPDVWLEIHGHGGPAVLRLIEQRFAVHGIEPCTWRELERRTNGPPWRSAAQEWLVQAPTARTAAILLDQYDGAFQRAMEAMRTAPPEIVQPQLQRLVQLVPLGRHLVRPWSVVIGGAPNVGKSSLVNALAGYARSIVAPTPGTTRDVVSTVIAIDGWPVELHDTAGLREAGGAIEAEGIARARAAAADADLRLWVLDGSCEPVFPVADAACVGHDGWHLLINKCDLPPAWDWSRVPEALHVSAHTGAGVPELCMAISRRLVPQPPEPGEAVPFSDETCDEVLRTIGD
jgi:tRNA modification GTPase